MGAKLSVAKLEKRLISCDEESGKVDFVGCALDAECAAAIAKFLAGPNKISELNLAKNEIMDEGAVAIAAALPDNLHLHRMVLANNQLTDACLQPLMDAVMVNRHLRDLDLYNNNLTMGGAEHIARMLRKDHHLERLLLGSNDLRDEGVIKLCDAVKKNHRTKLHKLGLSSNKITELGAQKLMRLVDKYNQDLITVELGFNVNLQNKTLDTIRLACEKNKNAIAANAFRRNMRNGGAGITPGKQAALVAGLTEEQRGEFKDAFSNFDQVGLKLPTLHHLYSCPSRLDLSYRSTSAIRPLTVVHCRQSPAGRRWDDRCW